MVGLKVFPRRPVTLLNPKVKLLKTELVVLETVDDLTTLEVVCLMTCLPPLVTVLVWPPALNAGHPTHWSGDLVTLPPPHACWSLASLPQWLTELPLVLMSTD